MSILCPQMFISSKRMNYRDFLSYLNHMKKKLSYCQELCMRESGGVPNFLNTIDKLYSSNDFT